MPRGDEYLHLDEISTSWKGTPEDALDVMTMICYAEAVRRYLLAILRNPDAAADQAQQFFLKLLLRRRANGKELSDVYLRRAMRSFLADCFRGAKHPQPRPLSEAPDPASSGPGAVDAARREELMTRAWKALEGYQDRTGQPLHRVLRLQFERPELKSPEMAKLLTARLGKPVSDGWVRQNLHRARDKFADYLLDEVEASSGIRRLDELEQKLIDLGLLNKYCRSALARRSRRAVPAP